MSRKFLVLCSLLSFVAISGGAQEKQQTPDRNTSQSAAASQNPQPAGSASMSRADLNGLQNDVKRMRVILHQMQNNMGAATNAQDPLKHQFELEIEMWQVVIDQMDRRIKAAGGE